jgi:hypothetical protein
MTRAVPGRILARADVLGRPVTRLALSKAKWVDKVGLAAEFVEDA